MGVRGQLSSVLWVPGFELCGQLWWQGPLQLSHVPDPTGNAFPIMSVACFTHARTQNRNKPWDIIYDLDLSETHTTAKHFFQTEEVCSVLRQ